MKAKLRIIGGILTVLSMILLFIKISTMELNWSVILGEKYLRSIVFCIALYAGMMTLCYIPWMKLVEICCEKIGQFNNQKLLFCYVFLKANIMKYIPGNILQYIGRNEIAFELGLSHIKVAMASVAEIAIITTTALILSISAVRSYTVFFLRQWTSDNILLVLIIIAITIFSLSIVHHKYHRWAKKQVSKIGRSLNNPGVKKNLLIVAAFYLLLLLANAFVFIYVLKLDDNATITSKTLPVLVGSYMLSWLIGYITPGSPGGIGIREIILISIMKGSGVATESAIIQAAVIARFISITGDMVAYMVALYRHIIDRTRIRKGEA